MSASARSGRPLWSAHLSTLFQEHDVAERPRAAAAAGFTHVESWWPGSRAGEWARAVARAGLRVSCLNADGGDLAAGDRGFLNVPSRRDEALAAVAAAVNAVSALGGGAVNVLVGRATATGMRSRELDTARGVLRECAGHAAASGVTLVIEHLNEHDVPGSLLPTPEAAARFVASLDMPSVRLLYDAYHAAMAGLDPVRDVHRYGHLIGHAQYADAPGRGAPGTGEVDLEAFVAALGDAGYGGPVGSEFSPRGRTVDALGFMRRRSASTSPRSAASSATRRSPRP